MPSTDTQARRIDGDRVDDGYRQWPRVLLTLAIGVLLGALVGAAYGATRPVVHQAGTALSVLPDPTVDITSQNNNENSTPTLDAPAYIQSQLVIINGRQLADEVRDSLRLSSLPDVTASQVGQTYVVQIQASAGSAARAAAIARKIGAQYIALRTEQLKSEISGLLSSTNQQLSGVSSSLASQRRTSSASEVTPSQTALQTEYERLLSVRSTLNAVLAQADRVVTVVTPARATDAALSPTSRDALGGSILGAAVALALFFTLRRSRHRVRGLTDLAELDVPVLLPVLPRQTLAQLRKSEVSPGVEARVLAARLVADAGSERRPLVFVATSSGDGAATVSAAMAAAVAGSGPVLLVRVGAEFPADDPWFTAELDALPRAEHAGVVHSSIPGVWVLDDAEPLNTLRLLNLLDEAPLLGWQLVVDAGAMSRPDVAIRCARAGAAVVLVVDRGRATPSAVLAATELFEATGTGLMGAVLNDPPGVLASRLRRRSMPMPTEPSLRHTEPRSLSSLAVSDEGSGIPSPVSEYRSGDLGGRNGRAAARPGPAHRSVR